MTKTEIRLTCYVGDTPIHLVRDNLGMTISIESGGSIFIPESDEERIRQLIESSFSAVGFNTVLAIARSRQ